jgi:16S rRNA (adenine1518-N6/adenine1519-N6)-dimethyltransferase
LKKYFRPAGVCLQTPAAKKSLGQNFLRDPNIARKIVGLLHITAEDSVLEIGPGPGALTRFILEQTPARLLAVEKDAYWAEELMRCFAEYSPAAPPVTEQDSVQNGEAIQASGGRLQVLQADALALPFERFLPGWKVIGNLPYNIASPLLWELFSRMPSPARAVFMLQKEVGLRITAAPGDRAYGALSVWLQSFMCPRAAFLVPPHVFHPQPRVESAVLVFEPHAPRAAGECGVEHPFAPADLARVLHACFRMRRKQMGSIAAAAGIAPQSLASLCPDLRARPENLTPRNFQRIAAARLFI